MDFSQKHCVPCEGNEAPLSDELVQQFLVSIPGWELQDGKLHREFKFKDFNQSIKFVNKVADIAEEEGHHPDIYLGNLRRKYPVVMADKENTPAKPTGKPVLGKVFAPV